MREFAVMNVTLGKDKMVALADQDLQDKIGKFVSEARFCAQKEKGFAAMSTIFNVVLAVSETVHVHQGGRPKPKNKPLFKLFVRHLTSKTSWLKTRDGKTPKDKEIWELLNDIRNGMAHALSLPTGTKPEVVLVNAIGEAPQAFRKWTNAYYAVSTTDFIDVVEDTVAKMSQQYSGAPFDPGASDREIAAVRTMTMSGTIFSSTSASGVD